MLLLQSVATRGWDIPNLGSQCTTNHVFSPLVMRASLFTVVALAAVCGNQQMGQAQLEQSVHEQSCDFTCGNESKPVDSCCSCCSLWQTEGGTSPTWASQCTTNHVFSPVLMRASFLTVVALPAVCGN